MAEVDEKRPIIGYSGSLQTALIVDDNAHNRLVLTTLLEPIGFAIVEAENGKDAVRFAQDICPQVIIMDAVMPLMNGMEATRHIRQIPELQNVLIIAVSAGAYEATRTDCLDAGSDAFLPKPFQVEELLDLLAEHLLIQWIYDEEDVVADHEMILPCEDVLRELYNLAVIGDYFGMKSQIEILVQEEPNLLPFVYRLRGMIEQFDDGLIDFLKSVWLD